MSYLAVVLASTYAIVASPADIQLPQPPVVPSPAPDPGAVLTLGTDQLYVAQSDAEFVVRDHPRGLVKVTYEKGPIRVRARFAGGFATETKTFDGPFVAFVEAAGKGRVELDFVPIGLKAEKDIRFAVVDVDGNAAPRPPPDPPKPPEPKPLPDGPLGLVKASREGAEKVKSEKKAAEAVALAKAQRAHASAVAAGAFPTAAKVLDGWRAANNVAAPAAVWGPWGEAVAARLSALFAEGKLKTNADWAAAFNEAAEGLGG